MIKIYAPASIGNLSVGFDILGAAIVAVDEPLLGDCVIIEDSKKFILDTTGKFVGKLPKNPKKNIIYQCWLNFCKKIGKIIPVKITLEKNIPIGSGLGSSACSIVAGLVAMNEYCGTPLDNLQLLKLMGELEGYISGSIHYDNVAPCFLGGLQLILEEPEIINQSLPIFEDWLWVIAYPGITSSTFEARAILPEYYKKDDCVQQARFLAGFIHACYTKQPNLALKMIKDRIAEPYRIKLLPGFMEARQAAQQIGMFLCGISGAGPTIFSICNNMLIANNMKDWLTNNYLQNSEGFVHICYLDKIGVKQLG